MPSTTRPLINVADIPLVPHPMAKPAAGFEARFAQIAGPLGATKLGCNLTVVPAGKKAWPHHVHHANDEMFVVLAGEGTLRVGAERYPVRAGDVIVCPAGNAERAHQLINTGAAELRYLSISTKILPEIAEYPDSGKLGAISMMAGPGDAAPRQVRLMGRLAESLDYYDGET
jgi:uncharacterized cupin superfamily protein